MRSAVRRGRHETNCPESCKCEIDFGPLTRFEGDDDPGGNFRRPPPSSLAGIPILGEVARRGVRPLANIRMRRGTDPNRSHERVDRARRKREADSSRSRVGSKAPATVRPPGFGARSQRASTGRPPEETRLPELLRRSVHPRWPPLRARPAGPTMGHGKRGPAGTGSREGAGDVRLSLGSGGAGVPKRDAERRADRAGRGRRCRGIRVPGRRGGRTRPDRCRMGSAGFEPAVFAV
jgi:hypothetical protein